MSRQRKYEKGEPICSLADLVYEFNDESYIFFNNKLLHFSFWGSWRMCYLAAEMRAGRLFYAHKIDKEAKP
jgi:hypothetical protein